MLKKINDYDDKIRHSFKNQGAKVIFYHITASAIFGKL